MSIRLVYDTRKLQKYVIMQGNWALRGQNHVLCYFFRNMELICTILHQSFVQISFVGLENNLNALYANNACFRHQEVAKNTSKCKDIKLPGGQYYTLYYFSAKNWKAICLY